MSTPPSQQDSAQKGIFQQVKPRWIAENLALAGLGFGLGHYAGGAAAGLAAGHPREQKMSPEARRRIVQTAQMLGGLGGVGTGFTLNQMRLAMNERLRRKRLEAEAKEKGPPTPEKVASILKERGWR